MRFRPLCIDYHSRAQEIIITERGYTSRWAEQSLISHHLGDDGNVSDNEKQDDDDDARSVDYSGDDDDRLDFSTHDHDDGFVLNDENKDPSNSENALPQMEKYHSVEDNYPTKSNDDRPQKTHYQLGGIGNANSSRSSKTQRSILSIMALLGPAADSKKIGMRAPSPTLTRGPIRGQILPVDDGTIPAMEQIEMHAKIGQEKSQMDIIPPSTSEDCRSNERSFIDDATMFLRSGYSTISEHPMPRCDQNTICDDAVLEDVVPSSSSSFEPLVLLRHEPEDLIKIQKFKSLQMLESLKNSASEIMKQMEAPRLRLRCNTPTNTIERGLLLHSGPTSAKPPNLCLVTNEKLVEMHSNDFDPNKNALTLVSFYDDCHGRLAGLGSPECPILQSRRIPNKHAEDTFFMIRLDPDFDPLLGQQKTNVQPMDSSNALARSLGEMCNAEYLLQEMALPSRFDNKNDDDQVGLPLRISLRSKQKFDFMDKALQKFKVSKKQEDDLLPPFHLDGLLDKGMMSFPKRITLESDISLYDDDSIKPTADCQPNVVIELPSAALSLPFSCARKVAGGINAQKRRFVDSSARVCKIDALSNICGPSKVSCLFIPQIDVSERNAETLHVSSSPMEQQKPESIDDLISFVRSYATSTIPESDDLVDGVDLLPDENDSNSYPILSWFECDDDMDEGDQYHPIKIDPCALLLKRKTFCSNAVRVGDEERSRCVLFTGCSSRMNASRKYSYRGFLSNHIVNPRVFQQRYHSMIEMNKLCQREIISTSNISAIGQGQSNFYFSRMVIADFADRFSSKKKNSNSRKAPFAPSLKTRRHGRKANPLKMKEGVALVSKQPPVVVPEIENLSSYSYQTKNLNDDDVGRLGRENLNIRGELLHLVTKARELKEEEDAYLEELAMINRDREGAPNHASFEDDTISTKIDIGNDCTVDTNGKRKVSDDVAIGGDAKEKKKRRKDKKKKEKKKKKKSKRKRRDDLDFIDDGQMDSSSNKIGGDCDPSSKCEGEQKASSVKKSSVKKLRIDENVPHTTQKSWVAVPTKIALGITPIHRPKDLQKQTQAPSSSAVLPHTTPKVLEKRDNCNTSTSTSSGKSPDSVAATNLFAESDQKMPKMRSQAPSESGQIAMEQDSDKISEIDNGYDRSLATESHYNGEKMSQDEVSPLTILTSENFLESFGDSIVELANGRWFAALTEVERLQITRLLKINYHSAGTGLDLDIPTRMKLNVCDCPLLDISGADIELGDGKALIVQRISQLNEGDMNKNFIKRIVMLGASGRYRHIHVILCIDTDIRPQQILLMQNALMQQSGCPCENISFEYTSLRTLSSSIALQFCNSSDVHKSSRISQYATEENIQERARFLICLVPTMTVHVALRCLCSDSCHDGGATAIQKLMSMASNTTRELFPHKVTSLMPKTCAEQLWLVANVNSSFASR